MVDMDMVAAEEDTDTMEKLRVMVIMVMGIIITENTMMTKSIRKTTTMENIIMTESTTRNTTMREIMRRDITTEHTIMRRDTTTEHTIMRKNTTTVPTIMRRNTRVTMANTFITITMTALLQPKKENMSRVPNC